MKNNTFYFLKVASRYCRFEIRINGIRAFFNHTGNQSGSEMPINEYLLKGKNVVQLSVRANDLNPAEFQFDLIGLVDMKIESRTGLQTPQATLWASREEQDIRAFTFEKEYFFESSEGLDAMGYEEAKVLEPEDIPSLWLFFQELVNRCKGRNWDFLQQQIGAREALFSQAYGLNPADRVAHVVEMIRSKLAEPEAEVFELTLDRLEPRLYGFGKMVSFVDKSRGRHGFAVYAPEKDTTMYFPFFLGIRDKTPCVLR